MYYLDSQMGCSGWRTLRSRVCKRLLRRRWAGKEKIQSILANKTIKTGDLGLLLSGRPMEAVWLQCIFWLLLQRAHERGLRAFRRAVVWKDWICWAELPQRLFRKLIRKLEPLLPCAAIRSGPYEGTACKVWVDWQDFVCQAPQRRDRCCWINHDHETSLKCLL